MRLVTVAEMQEAEKRSGVNIPPRTESLPAGRQVRGSENYYSTLRGTQDA